MVESERSKGFRNRMKECAGMKPNERYTCQRLAISSNVPRMSLKEVSDIKRKSPEIARIIKKFPPRRPDQENVEQRMERRMEEKKILKSDVYKEFIKDRMTSAYQDRVFRIMQKIDGNELYSMRGVKDYYKGLKPIKEQTDRIIN